jgi:hypothetical protein
VFARCTPRSLQADPPRTGLVGLAAVATLVLVACSDQSGGAAGDARELDRTVIAIDRTGVTANETWPADVGTQVTAEVERGLDDGVDSIELIGIGSTPNDTMRWATIDLTRVDGNTEAKRQAARQDLVTSAGATARRLVEEPVGTDGTDVLSALTEAAALCRDPRVRSCSILMVTDLEDQRVTDAPSVEAAVDSLAPQMPRLDDIAVRVTGLGASGADAALVTKVNDAWSALLQGAGAADVRIARSL